MLPGGIAYSRPAAARVREAARQNRQVPLGQTPRQTTAKSTGKGASAVDTDERANCGPRASVNINVDRNLTLDTKAHALARGSNASADSQTSYRASLGMSPVDWRSKATPRPGQPVQAGEGETVVCVVEPAPPPRRPGDPPRRPGDAMPAETPHGAYTTGHIGFLAHTPRGELPPMRLDGKASRGRRGIANSWEREFRGAATILRAGVVPLEHTLQLRQWENEAR